MTVNIDSLTVASVTPEIELFRAGKKIGMIESITAERPSTSMNQDSITATRMVVFELPLVVGEVLTIVSGGRGYLIRVKRNYQYYDVGQDYIIYGEQEFSRLCECGEPLDKIHLKKCLIYLVNYV